MYVESLELSNFRNYEKLNLKLDENTNILHGDNAQGKTNVLEAIYFAGTSKSHKGSKEKEIIRFGEDEAHIKMIVKKNGISERIDMHLRKNKSKGIGINGLPIRKASELFGIVNIVFFSPEDLNLIKNGPTERRKFVDLELCQLDKIYLYNTLQYQKILNQRNKLLKELLFHNNDSLEETLELWDMQLVNYGSAIINRRREFVKQLNEIIYKIHKSISGDKEEIEIHYEPDVLEEDFSAKLEAQRNRDIKLGYTTVGPHKDDLAFYINSVDIRKFGSQGQQRTSALSLKLAELELVKMLIGDTPILLLDDVLSELDSNRQNHLLNTLGNIQTIITCTGVDEFVKNRFQINKTFHVVNGEIH